MSRHLKILAALMMWVVVTAGIAAAYPNPASASQEVQSRNGIGDNTLLHLAYLSNRTGFASTSKVPLGAPLGIYAAQAGPPEGEGVKNYFEEMGDKVWRPAPRISPPVGADQVVGLETWLAIDEESWKAAEWSDPTNSDMKYVANPVATIWTFSDQVVVCEGPGVQYTEGAEGPAPCGRTWNHTTEVAEMTMEVAIEYEITWTEQLEKECTQSFSGQGGGGTISCEGGGDGESGTYVQKGDSLKTYDLSVSEIQTIGTRADFDYSIGGTVDDFRSDQEAISSELGYPDECGNFQIFCDIGDSVKEALTELIELAGDIAGFVIKTLIQGISWLRSLLPPWAKAILDFLEGCVDWFDEIIQELLTSALSMISDPVGHLEGVFEDILLAVDAFWRDPVEFAKQLAIEVTRADDAEENLAAWAGSWVCEYALSAASGKIPNDIFDWLNGVPDAPDDLGVPTTRPDRSEDGSDKDKDEDNNNNNNNNNNDNINDEQAREEQENYYLDNEPICQDSFPAGTPVLGANGSYTAIELVRVGDEVLSFDPDTATWAARTVTAQWSNIDTGAMVTVVLEDGSQLVATDHHPFWEVNSQTWVDAEDLSTGDLLVGPAETHTVGSVLVHEPRSNLVWELSVEVDHTFVVSTGTADVAVHNATCLKPGTSAHKTARWKKYKAKSALGKNAGWSKSRWENNYNSNITKAKNASKRMDNVKQQLENSHPGLSLEREKPISTSLGERRLDMADTTTKHGVEHKSHAYATTGKFVRAEIAKDAELIGAGWTIEWIFDGTASQPLKDLLTQNGIPYIENFPT